MESRITIIIHGNEDMISLGITKKLCDYENMYSAPEDEELPRKFISFRKRLRDVAGVREISIGKYEIRIERYKGFFWREILPTAIDVVKKYARFTDARLVTRDTRPTRSYDDDGYSSMPIVNLPVNLGIEAEPFSETIAA